MYFCWQSIWCLLCCALSKWYYLCQMRFLRLSWKSGIKMFSFETRYDWGHAPTRTHAQTNMHTHVQTHTHKRAHVCTQTRIHINSYTSAGTLLLQLHKHTKTVTHTRARAHNLVLDLDTVLFVFVQLICLEIV